MAIKLYKKTDYESVTSGGTDGVAIQSVYVYDAFTDSNGTALNSHTPDIDVEGSGWESITRSAPPGGGDIQGNEARLTTDNGGHVIDSGVSDGIVEVDWTPAVGVDNRNGLVFRMAGDRQWWWFR
ncbi:MAG: hypothetical protein PVJ36_02400, partial [Nitrospirota bacterium]